MMTRERGLRLIQEAIDSLKGAGLVEQDVTVGADTVLLGASSPLDSIAFVTFMTELEDRLYQELRTDSSLFGLVLEDIHEFNPDKSHLSANALAEYIVKLSEQEGTHHE